MKHTMRLNAQPFDMIERGTKTIEMRLYDAKRRAIRIGDQIEFINLLDSNRHLYCTVVGVYVFASFKELYCKMPLLKCGYTEQDISTASYTDMEKYYTAEQQREYGVVGIEVKVL